MIDRSDPDACDARTGECLKCLYNRASPDCIECADGYYEEDGQCLPCGCDLRGTDPSTNNEDGNPVVSRKSRQKISKFKKYVQKFTFLVPRSKFERVRFQIFIQFPLKVF